MTRRTAWFTAFAHPTPTKLEDWLERLAADGWEPRDVDDMSAVRLRLHSTKPAKVRYVVDPQQRVDDSYRATYEDAGWTYVGELSSLHVWRRRYKDQRPEAFTDNSSRVARDRRLAWVTGTVGALALVGAAIRLALGIAGKGASSGDWPLEAGLLALIGLPLVALTFALARGRKV